jgi:hypothetical protein
MQLLNLPEEMLIEVLSYLPQKTSVSLSCKSLNEICQMMKDKTLFLTKENVNSLSRAE